MKQAELSDFQFHVARYSGVNVLVIIDLDMGGRSVTNSLGSRERIDHRTLPTLERDGANQADVLQR